MQNRLAVTNLKGSRPLIIILRLKALRRIVVNYFALLLANLTEILIIRENLNVFQASEQSCIESNRIIMEITVGLKSLSTVPLLKLEMQTYIPHINSP